MLQTQNYFETNSGLNYTPPFSFYYQKYPLGLAKFRRHYIAIQNTAQHGSIRNQRPSRIKRR
jgi:hypothetical protein